MNRRQLKAQIASLYNRLGVDYSREEYERYKKQHPTTKKQPNDPLFQLKQPSKQPVKAPQQPTQAPQQQAQKPQPEGQPQTVPQSQPQAPVDEKSLAALKGTGKKVREVYTKKKEAIHAHVKKEVKELKAAGTAIKKFVNKEPLTPHELEAVKGAASKVAGAVISMALGGHMGAGDLVQHFAVEGVADAAAAAAGPHEHHEEPAHTTTPNSTAHGVDENNITRLNFKVIGKRLKDTFTSRKDAIVHHLKHKVKEFKEAGSAIGKFVRGEQMSPQEHKALTSAAKEVASATIFAAFGHHFGILSIGEFLAIGTIAQAAVARLPKHGVFMSKIGSHNEEDVFIEMIMENVMKQLEKMEGYTPQQLRDLARKIRQNVEHDPKVRRELQQQFGKK